MEYLIHGIWVFKTMYMEYKNVKCEIYTSSTTELALRYWSYPGHEQIPSNGDDAYYPEHPSIIRTAVAIYQQEHNAAKIAGCARHARDETCDTDQPLVAHIDSTVVSTGLTIRRRMYMRHQRKTSSITSFLEESQSSDESNERGFRVGIQESNDEQKHPCHGPKTVD